MRISSGYFHAIPELVNKHKEHNAAENAFLVLEVISYITIVVPVCVWASSLCGRTQQDKKPSSTIKKTDEVFCFNKTEESTGRAMIPEEMKTTDTLPFTQPVPFYSEPFNVIESVLAPRAPTPPPLPNISENPAESPLSPHSLNESDSASTSFENASEEELPAEAPIEVSPEFFGESISEDSIDKVSPEAVIKEKNSPISFDITPISIPVSQEETV